MRNRWVVITVKEQSIVWLMSRSVGSSVCLREYLWNRMSTFHHIFSACCLWLDRIYSRGVAMRCLSSVCGWRHVFRIMDTVAACRYRSSVTARRADCGATHSSYSGHPCCVALVAFCPVRRRLPRLDEFIVQGVSGRSLRCTVTLLTVVDSNSSCTRCVCVCVCDRVTTRTRSSSTLVLATRARTSGSAASSTTRSSAVRLSSSCLAVDRASSVEDLRFGKFR